MINLICLEVIRIVIVKKDADYTIKNHAAWHFFPFFQKICEKPQIVNDYEAGRGIPNHMILGKIERVIGIKLRGKDIGTPMVPPAKKWIMSGGEN